MFFHESLELLPHLANLRLMLLPLGALHGRPLFVLGQRLLKGRHLSGGPYNSRVNPVTFCNCTFYVFQYGISYLPSPRAAAWLGRALLGPLEDLLQHIHLRI